MRVEPFAVAVPDAVLDDLRERIRRTRWPDPAPGGPWSQGTDLDYLRGLLAYWADGFDWRTQERWLNRFEHRMADVDGVRVHFVHHRAATVGCRWSSPTAGRARSWSCCRWSTGSVTGSIWSCRPCPATPSRHARRTGVDRAFVARLWHRLMQGLGYERYGAHGGDFGAGVATYMALSQPDRVIGIHLSTPEMWPYTGPGAPPLSIGGAGVRRPRRSMGRDGARLQRGAVHPAADAGVRAERFSGRPGRLGAGQVALLVGQRRRPQCAVRSRCAVDDVDHLVGHRVDHLINARLLRQPLAWHADRPG